MLGLLISFIAAVLPAFVYALIFYWADRYEREPLWLAAVTLIWGAIPAIIISLIAEIALGAPFISAPGSLAEQLVAGAVVAPIVEELAKGMALVIIFVWKRQEFDGVLDGLVYGALVGFGFAMTENFFYFIGAFEEGGYVELTTLIFLRSMVFGLNHAFYTGLMGIGLGIARNMQGRLPRLLTIAAGLAAAILVHALHNLGAGLMALTPLGFGLSLLVAGGGLALILLAIGLSWEHERRTVRDELADEVGVLLTEQELRHLTEHWHMPPIPRIDHSRNSLLVEYANRKRRLNLHGLDREPELEKQLEKLRTQLRLTASPSAPV